VKCHSYYVFLLRFVVHNCNFIFASWYAAAFGCIYRNVFDDV